MPLRERSASRTLAGTAQSRPRRRGNHPVLTKKPSQLGVRSPDVAYPCIGISEDHRAARGPLFGRSAWGAVPPRAARRSAACRAMGVRRASSMMARRVLPGWYREDPSGHHRRRPADLDCAGCGPPPGRPGRYGSSCAPAKERPARGAMILADTNTWVSHIRTADAKLAGLLRQNRVIT